jgi:hypothetical protein
MNIKDWHEHVYRLSVRLSAQEILYFILEAMTEEEIADIICEILGVQEQAKNIVFSWLKMGVSDE